MDMWRHLTDPQKDLAGVDDLTAILVPLSDAMRPYRGASREFGDLDGGSTSEVCTALREAARDLHRFEEALKPNPIPSLQRIVPLAALSVFFVAATRGHERAGLPRRVLLIDCSTSRDSPVAEASERCVSRVLEDAREYMAMLLAGMLREEREDWSADPAAALRSMLERRAKRHPGNADFAVVSDMLDELREAGANIEDELPRRLVELLDSSSGRSLDGFLRLLGIRCGLLYPQQKTRRKRFVPMDRTLEVLVAGTFELSGDPMEYRDFLDRLYDRWRLVVGGRHEDAALLARAGTAVAAGDLAQNSERFLLRLQRLGLARKLADSVAVVGLMESAHAGG